MLLLDHIGNFCKSLGDVAFARDNEQALMNLQHHEPQLFPAQSLIAFNERPPEIYDRFILNRYGTPSLAKQLLLPFLTK